MSDDPAPARLAPAPLDFRRVLHALADLRITVALLGLSVFLVLAGTLAQVNHDIWHVVATYFRCWVAYVPLADLVPVTWFPEIGNPPGGFYFPGGWTLGAALAVNQLASMATKFRVRGSGAALWGGLAATAVGVGVTWLFVLDGMSDDGVQGEPVVAFSTIWTLFRVGLGVAAAAASVWSLRRLLDPARRREASTVLICASAVLSLALATWALFQGAIGESSVRILWLLLKGTFAAAILLAGLVPIFGRQAGTFLLHCGLLMLLASEFHTGLTAREAVMPLSEGEAANFVQDTRDFELAFVTANPDGTETHAVVSADELRAALAEDRPIADDRLPAAVTPVALFDDASPLPPTAPMAASAPDPPADAVDPGFRLLPVEAGTGVEMGAVDYPGGFFRLTGDGGESLGTLVLSALLDGGETVEIGGEPVRVALRFTREYLPYAVRLNDVSATFYPGTATPKDYRSGLRITPVAGGANDAGGDAGGESFEAFTWMNNPLRYAGRTFYQSGYSPAKDGRPEGSTLQVVTNTGWMIPYVACMILAVGMLAQFGMSLLRFLARRTSAPADENRPVAAPVPAEEPHPAGRWGWVFPLAVVVVLGGYAVSKWRPPAPATTGEKAGFDLAAFETIPVLHGGRFKPVGSVAREALKTLTGNKQTFPVGEPYRLLGLFDRTAKEPAARWLLDVIADPGASAGHRVYHVPNPQVRETLGLERRKGFLYSLDEILDAGDGEADALRIVKERSREASELRAAKEPVSADLRAFEELDAKLTVFDLFLRAFKPAMMPATRGVPGSPDPPLVAYRRVYDELWASNRVPLTVPRGPRWETLAHVLNEEEQEARLFPVLGQTGMTRAEFFAALPAEGGPIPGLRGLLTEPRFDGEPDPVADAWLDLQRAWAGGEASKFNLAVRTLTDLLYDAEAERREAYDAARAELPLDRGRVRLEAWFNEASPLLSAWVLAIAATVFTVVGWALVPLGWGTPARRAAFWLLVLTFAIQTAALAVRIHVSGRPPVTNLYSSAVFIGWGAVGLGLLLELLYGWGVGNALACVGGVGTLLIAHSLSNDDTFAVLQAVLDTQFWLATHVVTITLGYAATGAAGLLGLFYVFAGLFTRALRTPVGKPGTRLAGQTLGQALTRMIYGCVCFAALLSLVGTILGGLWADDSWGRFWGWDPKENGAMLIVIWNALLLHARWGKLAGDRGVALLAVAGNVAVAWSWFGVNELGVGLHSYGFTEGVLRTLGAVVAFHLAVLAAGGFTPKWAWRSFRPVAGPAAQ